MSNEVSFDKINPRRRSVVHGPSLCVYLLLRIYSVLPEETTQPGRCAALDLDPSMVRKAARIRKGRSSSAPLIAIVGGPPYVIDSG